MSRCIVVADDEADIRRLVSWTLRRQGYTVLEAVDGREALRLIRNEHPDLAVLDIMMPNMSGLDVVREMAASSTTATIPVLFVSARGHLTDIQTGAHVASARYLPKPFSPRDLVDKVVAILEQ